MRARPFDRLRANGLRGGPILAFPSRLGKGAEGAGLGKGLRGRGAGGPSPLFPSLLGKIEMGFGPCVTV